jgi:4-hydroxybenzoate polyprenyltransferase
LIGKRIRDVVNLLLYGGGFIGLCAACLTAFTFELTGTVQKHLGYIYLIGAATASLYSLHKVIGLQRTLHLSSSGRYATIRIYQFHIRVYTVIWLILACWLLLPLLTLEFIYWLLPGGLIALLYVLPVFPERKRLRDYGWGKIILLGWSWSWLTCIIPMGYFLKTSPLLLGILGTQQMIFVMLLGIAFEIRDIQVDKSLGLETLPEKVGKKKTKLIAIILIMVASFLSLLAAFHYFNVAYGLSMTLACILSYPLILKSYTIDDDYYFTGLVDGMMIVIVWIFLALNTLLL